MRLRHRARQSSGGVTTVINPFIVQGFADGWRPNLQKSGMSPNSVADLLNVIWNDDFTLSKRLGFTQIADTTITGLGAADFVLAPRVYTVDGGVFPQYSQVVLHFTKSNGELFTSSLGKLWQEYKVPASGGDLVDSTHSIGAASDNAVNRFRVWPITAITFGSKIYMSTLRYGGYDDNTNQGDLTSAGLWKTQSGANLSPSLPIVYNVQSGAFARPALHDLDDGTSGFVACRTMIPMHARIFVANMFKDGVYRYPSRVYWSGTVDSADLSAQAETFMADSYIDVGANDGQEIVKMLPFGDQILIFKNQSVWTMVGTDQDTFALFQLDSKLGTEGTYAATATAGMAYFLDEKSGVWQFDGAQFTNISLPIRDKLIAELNREAAYKAVVEYHSGLLYVSIPVGAESTAVNTVTYVYDVELDVWTRWDYGVVPTPFPMFSDLQVTGPTVSMSNNLFSGRADKGVFILNNVLNDNGVAIASYVTTPWLNPGSVADRHRLRRLELILDADDALITVDVFTNLEFDVAKTTVYHDAFAGTETTMRQDQSLDSFLWTYLCLRFTQNGLNEDMNLFAIGMSISDRLSPRGVFTRTGYQHS